MFRRWCLLSVALFFSYAVAGEVPSEALHLAVHELIKTAPEASVRILTTLTNRSNHTVTLLNDPNTILTPSMGTRKFNIQSTEGGREPSFTGMAVKWSPELAMQENQTTTIHPGQTFAHIFSLENYDFNVSGAGNYTIIPNSNFQVITPSGVTEHIAMVSPITRVFTL